MYVGTKEVASILEVSVERVRLLLKQGRIKGSFKVGRVWVIPLVGGRPIIRKGRRGPKARWNRNHKVGVTKIYVTTRAFPCACRRRGVARQEK